ncbi:MAG: NeuD/PglB/VioB family sugar acetyltransferase [Pirellulales bacterium]
MTDTAPPYVLLGAGGHAAVLLEAYLAAGGSPPSVVLDADSSRHGQTFWGVPIAGSDDLLEAWIERGVRHFLLGIGSAGSTHVRQKVYQRALALGGIPLGVLHPSVYVSPSARLGQGVQLLPKTIIHTQASLGDSVIVNTAAVVEHDCVVGSHVHIATGAVLAGGVTIGNGAHIGVGAVVRQGLEIGPGAVVGAGAAVVKDVPPRTVVAGVPARVLRELPAG